MGMIADSLGACVSGTEIPAEAGEATCSALLFSRGLGPDSEFQLTGGLPPWPPCLLPRRVDVVVVRSSSLMVAILCSGWQPMLTRGGDVAARPQDSKLSSWGVQYVNMYKCNTHHHNNNRCMRAYIAFHVYILVSPWPRLREPEGLAFDVALVSGTQRASGRGFFLRLEGSTKRLRVSLPVKASQNSPFTMTCDVGPRPCAPVSEPKSS